MARRTRVSLRSVRRIALEPDPCATDEAEKLRRKMGRPRATEKFIPSVARLLDRNPALATAEILRRLRVRGYAGGKTAVYDLVAALRRRRARALQLARRRSRSGSSPGPRSTERSRTL